MPRGNGMGPWNMGPGTGRGFGPCGAGFRRGPGFGAGYGRRFGAGFGAGFGPGYGVEYQGFGLPYGTEVSRKEFLEEQQKFLKRELAQIERELESENS